MVKNSIFRDAEGNYYKSILDVELEEQVFTDEDVSAQKTFYIYKVKLSDEQNASDVIKTAKYRSLVDNQIYSLLNNAVIEVWVTSGETLSTLNFENNLNWINKM